MSLSDLPGWHSDVDSTGSAGSSCGSFKSSIGSNKSTNSVRVEEIRRRIRRSGESNSTTRHKPKLASPLLADNHGNELDSETVSQLNTIELTTKRPVKNSVVLIDYVVYCCPIC